MAVGSKPAWKDRKSGDISKINENPGETEAIWPFHGAPLPNGDWSPCLHVTLDGVATSCQECAQICGVVPSEPIQKCQFSPSLYTIASTDCKNRFHPDKQHHKHTIAFRIRRLMTLSQLHYNLSKAEVLVTLRFGSEIETFRSTQISASAVRSVVRQKPRVQVASKGVQTACFSLFRWQSFYSQQL